MGVSSVQRQLEWFSVRPPMLQSTLSHANESLNSKITVWEKRTRSPDNSRQYHTAPVIITLHTQLRLGTFHLYAYTFHFVSGFFYGHHTLPVSGHGSFHSTHTSWLVSGLFMVTTHFLTRFKALYGHHTLTDTFWGSFWLPQIHPDLFWGSFWSPHSLPDSFQGSFWSPHTSWLVSGLFLVATHTSWLVSRLFMVTTHTSRLILRRFLVPTHISWHISGFFMVTMDTSCLVSGVFLVTTHFLSHFRALSDKQTHFLSWIRALFGEYIHFLSHFRALSGNLILTNPFLVTKPALSLVSWLFLVTTHFLSHFKMRSGHYTIFLSCFRALSVVLSLFPLRGQVTRLLAAALVATMLSFTSSDLS